MIASLDAVRPFLLWPMGYRADEIGRMTPAAIFEAFRAYRAEVDREEKRWAWALAWVVSALTRKPIQPSEILERSRGRRRGAMKMDRAFIESVVAAKRADAPASPTPKPKAPTPAAKSDDVLVQLEADLRD